MKYTGLCTQCHKRHGRWLKRMGIRCIECVPRGYMRRASSERRRLRPLRRANDQRHKDAWI